MLSIVSCSNEQKAKDDSLISDTSKKQDTVKKNPENFSSELNFIDAKGNRQGKWVIYGKMVQDKKYNDLSKVEEGTYKDNLKEGEWIEYNPEGSVKRKVNYLNGKEVK